MPAFATDDDSKCPECNVRLNKVQFELGHDLMCFECNYKISVAYGNRVLTIEEKEASCKKTS